jgi:putative hydrolase of HD superfamily
LPEGLDLQRALTYALLHDLAEAWTGDKTPYDGLSRDEKLEAERAALAAALPKLPRGAALLAAWEAYEAQQDAESRFVRQLDRLDMGLQARIYGQQGADTREHRVSAQAQLTDPHLLAWLRAAHDPEPP